MLDFAHDVLTKQLERPTIAVIEAEGWRNARSQDEKNRCWTQLASPQLFEHRNWLNFDAQRRCAHFLRNSPGFTSGEILLPYPMHLGEKLIRDQLVIIGATD